MPYANEHAARLVNPDKFERFTRTNDKFGDGIHAIWGWVKDKSELQAIRFTASKWTVEEAKAWLKKNEIKYISFEAAKALERMYVKKNCPAIIKDLDVKKGIVEGYFSTWGIVDQDGDEIMPGAYKKSLRENGPGSDHPRIMHLLQHDVWRPLHRFTAEGSIVEDNVGLKFRSKISQTSYGKDTLQLYEDKVINEHSVGIQITKNEFVQESHSRVLEAVLWEGSTVTWGSNMNTPTTAVKNLGDQEKAEYFIKRIETLTKALRTGSYTDETFILIELQLKQILDHYKILTMEPDDESTPIQPGGDPTGGKQVTLELRL